MFADPQIAEVINDLVADESKSAAKTGITLTLLLKYTIHCPSIGIVLNDLYLSKCVVHVMWIDVFSSYALWLISSKRERDGYLVMLER